MRAWYVRRILGGGGDVRRSRGIVWARVPQEFALQGTDRIVAIPRSCGGREADAAARMMSYFREHREAPLCTCGETETPDAVRRELKLRGFEYLFPAVCMSADLTRMRFDDESGTAHDVTEVDDLTLPGSAEHPSYGPMSAAAARNSLASSRAMALRRPRRVWNLGVVRDGELAGCVQLHVAGRVAGIYNVGVLRRYRRQRLGSTLVREACRRARDLGLPTVVLQNDPSLVPFYSSLGFSVVSSIDHWQCAPAALAAPEPREDAREAARGSLFLAPERFVTLAVTGRTADAARLLRAQPSIARATFPAASDATALHIAAYNGAADAVRMLLDAGSDVTARDTRFKASPLGWAVHGLGPEGPVFKREQATAAAALIGAGAEVSDEMRRTLETRADARGAPVSGPGGERHPSS